MAITELRLRKLLEARREGPEAGPPSSAGGPLASVARRAGQLRAHLGAEHSTALSACADLQAAVQQCISLVIGLTKQITSILIMHPRSYVCEALNIAGVHLSGIAKGCSSLVDTLPSST